MYFGALSENVMFKVYEFRFVNLNLMVIVPTIYHISEYDKTAYYKLCYSILISNFSTVCIP